MTRLIMGGRDGLCGCRRSVADFVADEEQGAQKMQSGRHNKRNRAPGATCDGCANDWGNQRDNEHDHLVGGHDGGDFARWAAVEQDVDEDQFKSGRGNTPDDGEKVERGHARNQRGNQRVATEGDGADLQNTHPCVEPSGEV